MVLYLRKKEFMESSLWNLSLMKVSFIPKLFLTSSLCYTLCLSDYHEENSKTALTGLCLLLSIEQVIAGLDRAVATMKKGEWAILTIHPDFGFGSSEVRRDLAVIPPSSNVVYEVEMLDFIKVIIIVIELWRYR